MKQRQSVILQGDIDWCRYSALSLLGDFDSSSIIWLSNQLPDNVKGVGTNKAQMLLGSEFDAVVIDGSNSLNPDTVGALIGTVVAGGAVIIMISDAVSTSLWQMRFNRICKQFEQSSTDFQVIVQPQKLVPLSAPAQSKNISLKLTNDQQQALAAILKVVHGHRRRPLVLSADRGRGKSAILGIAAAELVRQGKQTILITAPSLVSAATVFEHASRELADAHYSQGLLTYQTAVIKFVAPDVLVEQSFSSDVLLVDEAAAIPAAILEQLLDKFSRIVFASTIHGYEGTGRGFAVRFQKTLDAKTPDWNRCHMLTPIRWRDDDMLEAFSFEALLLDAVPESDQVVDNATSDLCVFEQVDRLALIKDESTLRSLFGLMVLAHYRTRPSDLMMMLDRDDISVYVMRFQGHIVASAWCVTEGELDSDLAEAIYAGQRRLKGHLLPQSMLAHAGISDAGALSYQRIIRLAVHPAVQSRGIGHRFLEHILQYAEEANIDVVGASFAANSELIQFWANANFQPMRLGIHHDEVSGSHALMMLSALSDSGQKVVKQGYERFSLQWPLLVQQQFDQIQPQLVVSLAQLLSRPVATLSQSERHELAAFAFKQRGVEFSQVVLWQALSAWITQPKFLTLSEQEQALCVMLIMQQRPVTEVAKQLAYSGKAQLITALRQSIAHLLS